MPNYEIKACREIVEYEKCWIKIEANSPEEALKFAKEHPDECEYMDGKTLDIVYGEWKDEDTWEVEEA